VRASAVLVNQPPGAPPANRLASAGADGRFTINDVFGQRLIRAEDLPPDWFVASVLHAGRDITDKPTEFGAKAAGLVVRIQKGATLQGSVSGGSNSGAAIVFPVDPLRRGYYSRFVKTSPIGVDGKFVIRGLPGGSYHVLRVPALTPNWDAPKELDKLVPQARTLVLRAGAVQMIQLPASGGR
jgi:hypothetical protein